MQQALEVWNKSLDGHVEKKWFPRLRILYGFEEDHAWSNGKNKVALGLRVLFFPILLGLAIANFFLWFLPLLWCITIVETLKNNSYSKTKSELKEIFTDLYGFDNGDSSNNKN